MPRSILVVLLGLLCTSTHAFGDALLTATWECGDRSGENEAIPFLTPIVSSHDEFTFNNELGFPVGPFHRMSRNQLVFAVRDGDSVIMRPSADVSAEVHYEGTPGSPGDPGFDDWGGVARAKYYGRVIALPGAPVGAAIPLKVRIQGHAQVLSGIGSAFANSRFTCLAGELDADINVHSNDPSDLFEEYDLLQVFNVSVGEIFEGRVEAGGDVAAGPASPVPGSIQAFADPSIEIDSDYEFGEFFDLQFSENVPMVPEPALVCLFDFFVLLVAFRPRSGGRPSQALLVS